MDAQRAARRLAAVFIASSVLGFSGAVSANLLANPGFETGDFSGWLVGGSTSSFGVATDGTAVGGVDPIYQPNFVNVRSGNFAGYALVNSLGIVNGNVVAQPVPIQLYQIVTLIPGATYSIGFSIGTDAAHIAGYELSDIFMQIFVGDFGMLRGAGNLANGSGSADFTQISGLFQVPNLGTTPFGTFVQFRIVASGTAPVNVSLDDFFMERVIPEPDTLALLGLGLAGLGLSRRKYAMDSTRA